MTRDDAYLFDILESARLALEHLGDVQRDEFEKDIMLQVGNHWGTTRRISKETKQKYPHLPWKDMLGMRNAAIHEYDDLDLDLVWDTATRDLPGLVKEIEIIISPE